MTEENSEQAKEIASKLAIRVRRGRQILHACEKELVEALKVKGKSLKEWADKFRVEIPLDPDDIQGLERAQSLISNAIQEAEYLFASYEAKAKAIQYFHDSGFAIKYVEEMENNDGKKVAAEKIKQKVLINREIDNTLAANQAAEIISEFFKKQVKSLEEARKGVENRTRLLALRIKLNS